MRVAAFAGAAAACLACAGAAAAASLGVSAARLTVLSLASSIAPATCTLTGAADDAYANQSAPGSTSGTASSLRVRSGVGSNRRTFVRFDLAACGIPPSALVTSARLELFLWSAPTASRVYEVHRVVAPWSEATLTWATQPGVAPAATASTPTGTASNVLLSWTVTADVQAFVDGTPNYGWRVRDASEGSAVARTGQFRSSEFGTVSRRPRLLVSYYP